MIYYNEKHLFKHKNTNVHMERGADIFGVKTRV